MSSGRIPFLLLAGALIAGGPAWAQEPSGGEATSWTDPPARTAPQEPEKAQPAAPEAKAPESKRTEPARAERAREPQKTDPQKTESTQAEQRQDQRQDQIRRAVERSTREREAEARGVRVPRRSVVERPAPRRLAVRTQRFSERSAPRLRERQALSRRSIRRPVYGYADPMPVASVDSHYHGGPSAWDEGPGPDFRARRIAQARSAGYLVVRSRSYAYPDGTVVRRLAPLGAEDFDD